MSRHELGGKTRKTIAEKGSRSSKARENIMSSGTEAASLVRAEGVRESVVRNEAADIAGTRADGVSAATS